MNAKESNMKKFLLLIFMGMILVSCVTVPKDIKPVKNFELPKYLGKWYEIARIDNSFEKGLTHVTAEYSLKDDGGVKVLNKGYSSEKDEWKEAEGKAYFIEDSGTGLLKVSFFGPFYGAYVIFWLDYENYNYALVTSSSKSYLWILSRTPEINDNIKQFLMDEIESHGFDKSKIMFVVQK